LVERGTQKKTKEKLIEAKKKGNVGGEKGRNGKEDERPVRGMKAQGGEEKVGR